MDALDTVAALHDLTDELRRLQVSPRESAEYVTVVIDTSLIGELDLTRFLMEKGFSGVRLAQAMGTFALAVRSEYELRYGKKPLRVVRRGNVVNLYTVMHRPLVEDVFSRWSR